MSAASNFPREMPRPWLVPDIVELLRRTHPEVTQRMVEEMLRDGEAPEIPFFGRAGNSRLFDEATVRAKLPAMQRWFDDTGPRMMRRRMATMQADEARRRAALKTPQWSDPVADARRGQPVPEGFMRAEPAPKKKAPVSRIGKPVGY